RRGAHDRRRRQRRPAPGASRGPLAACADAAPGAPSPRTGIHRRRQRLPQPTDPHDRRVTPGAGRRRPLRPPPLQAWLWPGHGVQATGLQPLIFSGVILLHVPYILGAVATLLLLDDLDEGGLRALSVSPLGVRGYLAYRTASTALAALLAVIAATFIAGPPAGMGWQRLRA